MKLPIYNAKFAAEMIRLIAREPLITTKQPGITPKQPIILQNKSKTFTI